MSMAEPLAAEKRSLSYLLPTGRVEQAERPLAVEAPISIEYNGIAYAVMMASPADLEDFAIGFSLSEGVIVQAEDIRSIEAMRTEHGWLLRIDLPADRMEPVIERARMRVSEGSCGLCGLENLEQMLRPLLPITALPKADAAAIFRALGNLPQLQPLTQETGAAHAAAFCAHDGTILSVREDIGRHNAFDKLLGALARTRQDTADGFVLLTARCSYELVEKAIIAGCPLLVTISAPSTLAVDRAFAHGLTLVALARSDSALIVADPHGQFPVEALEQKWGPE